MGLRKLFHRIVAGRRHGTEPPAQTSAAESCAGVRPVAVSALYKLKFRPQICFENRILSSILVIPPRAMEGDADAVLRAALTQRRDWIADGVNPPPLSIELPQLIAESASLAQPLIWEIDRQNCPPEEVIFTAPCAGTYSRPLEGLAHLSRQGCGIELDCLDRMGMAVIRDLKPKRARMRVSAALLSSASDAPGVGPHVLSLLALAERHGLVTLVEDVQSREQFDHLAQFGFGVAQGDPVAPLLDANACAQFITHTRLPAITTSLQRWPAA